MNQKDGVITIAKGSTVKINGLPCVLQNDTDVLSRTIERADDKLLEFIQVTKENNKFIYRKNKENN